MSVNIQIDEEIYQDMSHFDQNYLDSHMVSKKQEMGEILKKIIEMKHQLEVIERKKEEIRFEMYGEKLSKRQEIEEMSRKMDDMEKQLEEKKKKKEEIQIEIFAEKLLLMRTTVWINDRQYCILLFLLLIGWILSVICIKI